MEQSIFDAAGGSRALLALDDAGLPDDERLRSTLKDYFRWATSLMATYPESPADVPDGLSLPRWSWDGPCTAGGTVWIMEQRKTVVVGEYTRHNGHADLIRERIDGRTGE